MGILFSMGLELQEDLKKRDFSEQLRQQFTNNNIPLPQNITIRIRARQDMWEISDEGGNILYVIKKEDDSLNTYKMGIYDKMVRRLMRKRRWWLMLAITPRFVAYSFLGKYPLLFFPLYGRLKAKTPVTRDTDICIEGFQSSANSFFVHCFRRSNDIRISSHQHVIAQIKRAKRYRIPTVVLIRRPLDVVTSYMSRSPNLTVSLLLYLYIDFYGSLGCVTGNIVVARFETVTKNPNSVIEAVNQKFGACFDKIRDQGEVKNRFLINARPSLRPSEQREDLKEEIRRKVAKNPLLAKANRVYEDLLSVNFSV